MHEPHLVTLGQIRATLAATSQRQRLFSYLEGAVAWLTEGLPAGWRLWVRGEFASTLRPSPTALDLVVMAPDEGPPGFQWSLNLLSARPLHFDPGFELNMTVLRGDDLSDGFELDHERRRSLHRCLNDAGDQAVTGWLEVVGDSS
jgi:hypothetical protein